MDRENAEYVYSIECYSAIKNGNLTICENVVETWRHYAKGYKSDKFYIIPLICRI